MVAWAGLGASAATKFAFVLASHKVRDWIKRRRIASAYRQAAAATIAHCENEGRHHPSSVWNAVVDLLGSEEKSKQMAHWYASYSITPGDISTITGNDPEVQRFLQYFLRHLNQNLVDLIPMDLAILQEIITSRISEATLTILGALPDIADQSATTISAACVLPSDQDYRVDRPEFDQIARCLASARSDEKVGMVGLAGPGGVGKSLLAVHYARTTEENRALYLSLDSGSIRSNMLALASVLELNIPAENTNDQASRLVQGALAQFDGLLILDNAEDEAETRMFLPNSPSSCKAIITSRDQALLRSITQAEPILMGVFTRQQARQCFLQRLGDEQFEREYSSIDSLCELLGDLPIAVDVAAASIFANKESARRWLEAFPNEAKLLDELPYLTINDTQLGPDEVRRRKIVRAVLRLSLHNLTNQARGLLYALCCFNPGTGGPEPQIMEVAGFNPDQKPTASLELQRLHQRSIVGAPTYSVLGGQRFSMHRLMREVVRQEAGDQARDYETRFFNTYSTLPNFLSRLVNEHRISVGISAFHQEMANLEFVAKVMVGEVEDSDLKQKSIPRQVAEFAANIHQFAVLVWTPGFVGRILASGMEVAKTEGFDSLQAKILEGLGKLSVRRDQTSEAREQYSEALTIYQRTGERIGEANILRALGDLAIIEVDYIAALEHYKSSLAISRETHNRQGEANVLKGIAELEVHREELSDARQHFTEALVIYRENQDPRGEANVLRELGELEIQEDQLLHAREYLNDALLLYREVKDSLGEANTLLSLSTVERLSNKLSEARQYCGDALNIYRKIEVRVGEVNTFNDLGDLEMRENRLSEARQCYETALRLGREVGDLRGEAAALNNLGDLEIREGELSGARDFYEKALELYRRIGSSGSEANLLLALGDLRFRQDSRAGPRQYYEQALIIYRKLSFKRGEANALEHLGDAELRESERSKARGYYEDSLAIRRYVHDSSGEARALKHLGDLETKEGNFAEAREYYRKSLVLNQVIENRIGEANTILAIADLDSQEHDYQAAEKGFQTAINICQEIDYRQGLRNGWLYFGAHYLRRDKPKKALLALESSLQCLPKESDLYGYAAAVGLQQRAFGTLGDFQGIIACLRVLAEMGATPMQDYEEALKDFKEHIPEDSFSNIEKAIDMDPDSERSNIVQRAVEHGEAEDDD